MKKESDNYSELMLTDLELKQSINNRYLFNDVCRILQRSNLLTFPLLVKEEMIEQFLFNH